MKANEFTSSDSDEPGEAMLPEMLSIYVRAEHWGSDMQFHLDELGFLQKLTGKYFKGSLKRHNPRRLKSVTTRLDVLIGEARALASSIGGLLAELSNSFTVPDEKQTQHVKEHIDSLEITQVEFLKTYRLLKKEIFELAATAMVAKRLERRKNHAPVAI